MHAFVGISYRASWDEDRERSTKKRVMRQMWDRHQDQLWDAHFLGLRLVEECSGPCPAHQEIDMLSSWIKSPLIGFMYGVSVCFTGYRSFQSSRLADIHPVKWQALIETAP
jgi:hypothetical protein